MAAGRVLFISHDATRSGAPIALLTFMRWLKGKRGGAGGDWEMAAVFPAAGELLADFAAVAPVEVLDREGIGAGANSGNRALRLPFQPDLFYFNSVASAMRVPCRPPADCRSLCHVHELEFSIRSVCGMGSLAPFFGQFDRLIACSRAVGANLTENHGIMQDRIDVVHSFVAADAISAAFDRPAAAARVRAMLNLPADSLIVACVGTVEWRKGSDLFVHLARRVKQKYPDLGVHFVWVGPGREPAEAYRIEHDFRRMPEVGGTVHFVPGQRDATPFVAGADVYVLPSREDPFPLGCLESAACGTPIVCFARAGGAGELVEDDCGIIVPYADVEAMADAVVRILKDPAARQKMGQAARDKVRRLYDISVTGPMLVQAMERAVRSPARIGGGR